MKESTNVSLVVAEGVAARRRRFTGVDEDVAAERRVFHCALSAAVESASFASHHSLSARSFAASGDPASGSVKSSAENERTGAHLVEPASSI